MVDGDDDGDSAATRGMRQKDVRVAAVRVVRQATTTHEYSIA